MSKTKLRQGNFQMKSQYKQLENIKKPLEGQLNKENGNKRGLLVYRDQKNSYTTYKRKCIIRVILNKRNRWAHVGACSWIQWFSHLIGLLYYSKVIKIQLREVFFFSYNLKRLATSFTIEIILENLNSYNSGICKIIKVNSKIFRKLRIDKLLIEVKEKYENGLRDLKKLEERKNDYNKLIKSKCNHYAISSCFIIGIEDICNIVFKYIEKDSFKVKRIKKDIGEFYRLSINKEADQRSIDMILIEIRFRTGRIVNKLKMKVNKEVKIKNKVNIESTTILSLNINRIKNKIEELNYYLNDSRPTVICLQETGNKMEDKNSFIEGYKTAEMKAGNGGLGLLIGVRKDCDIDCKVVEKNEGYILIKIKNKDFKLYILNIYIKTSGILKKRTMEDIARLFKKYKEDKIIAVGDWNQVPDRVIKFMTMNG